MDSRKFTEQTLNRGILRCKDKIKDEGEFRDGLCKLRGEINEIVRGCADNVIVVIYLEGVLGEPLEFSHGKEKNRLVITVTRNGRYHHHWSDRTKGKYIRDGLWSFAKKICSILKYGVPPLMAALTAA